MDRGDNLPGAGGAADHRDGPGAAAQRPRAAAADASGRGPAAAADQVDRSVHRPFRPPLSLSRGICYYEVHHSSYYQVHHSSRVEAKGVTESTCCRLVVIKEVKTALLMFVLDATLV